MPRSIYCFTICGYLRIRNRKNKDDHYKKYKAALFVRLDLGVASISNKNWFYKLTIVGELIDDSHINVIMYYLRKRLSIP